MKKLMIQHHASSPMTEYRWDLMPVEFVVAVMNLGPEDAHALRNWYEGNDPCCVQHEVSEEE